MVQTEVYSENVWNSEDDGICMYGKGIKRSEGKTSWLLGNTRNKMTSTVARMPRGVVPLDSVNELICITGCELKMNQCPQTQTAFGLCASEL